MTAFLDNYDTAFTHVQKGSYFFIRVRVNNPQSQTAVLKFMRSNRRSAWIEIQPPRKDKAKPTLKVRLIKVKNKKSKQDLVFMTNVAEGVIRNKEAGDFYMRRWGIESSFKDLTDTLKMCQWHSLKINGILQEIYALLWLVNRVRRVLATQVQPNKEWLHCKYRKPNFKLIIMIFIDHLNLLIRRKYRKLRRILSHWVERSSENRIHLSRSYPRQVKRNGKNYTAKGSVPRRDTAV